MTLSPRQKEDGSSCEPVMVQSGRLQAPPSPTYAFHDRIADHYRGRWRYTVTEIQGEKPGFRLAFKRRSDAASFSTDCRVFGATTACRRMDSSGYRHGDDYKILARDLSAVPTPNDRSAFRCDRTTPAGFQDEKEPLTGEE